MVLPQYSYSYSKITIYIWTVAMKLQCCCFLGVYNYQVEEDINKLKLCVNSLLQEYSLNVNVKDDYIHELYVWALYVLVEYLYENLFYNIDSKKAHMLPFSCSLCL